MIGLIWSEWGDSFAFLPRAKIEEATSVRTGGSNPVAVPEKIFGLTLILDFFDRCHSLVSLPPPQAAVDSLPTGHAETYRTTVRMRRGRIYPARGTIDLKRTTDRLRRGRIPPARGTTDRRCTYSCSVNLP